MTTPASIRFNNPGAQYPGPSARKFGSTGTEIIGGGHKIAVFDNPVNGAAAQFDLLRRGYTGMTLGDAIRKWSGGNSSPAYAARVSNATGVSLDTPLTPEMINDPNFAIPFAKSAASWEAGRDYPMTDEQWREAHKLAGGGGDHLPRNGSMNGGFGTNPTGDAGVSGPIQTANPVAADTRFNAPVAPDPAKATTKSPGGGGSPLGGNADGLLAGLFGGGNVFQSLMASTPPAIPTAPQAQIPTVPVRQVDPASLLAIVQRRQKLGSA